MDGSTAEAHTTHEEKVMGCNGELVFFYFFLLRILAQNMSLMEAKQYW